jgi:hypothetical protein
VLLTLSSRAILFGTRLMERLKRLKMGFNAAAAAAAVSGEII